MEKYRINGGRSLRGEVEISGAKKYIRILKSEAGEAEDDTFRNEFPDPLAFMAEVQRSARTRND